MHISTVFEDESKFNYFEPYILCSSPELTSTVVPVNDNEWRTMVLHETFHGFQQKYPEMYDLEKNKLIWDVKSSNYFYATGFNIVRLLEKLEIEYKSDLFTNKDQSLFSVLTNYIIVLSK